jgi:hypothetical protein
VLQDDNYREETFKFYPVNFCKIIWFSMWFYLF